jgi:hypothetical protein
VRSEGTGSQNHVQWSSGAGLACGQTKSRGHLECGMELPVGMRLKSSPLVFAFISPAGTLTDGRAIKLPARGELLKGQERTQSIKPSPSIGCSRRNSYDYLVGVSQFSPADK